MVCLMPRYSGVCCNFFIKTIISLQDGISSVLQPASEVNLHMENSYRYSLLSWSLATRHAVGIRATKLSMPCNIGLSSAVNGGFRRKGARVGRVAPRLNPHQAV